MSRNSWELADLPMLPVPLEMPSSEAPDKSLPVSGKGRAYTYAVFGVYAALWGKTAIHLIKESSQFTLSLPLNPQESCRRRRETGMASSLVYGAIPTVANRSLQNRSESACAIACQTGAKIWIGDSDAAASTQDWYLKGMQSEAESVRPRVKDM